MALTIVAQPPSISLSKSPMIFDLHSADNTQTDHEYKLELFIWKGTKASIPASATYTLTKSPNSAGKAIFDVSRLVREYLELTKPSAVTASGYSVANAVDDCYWIKGKASSSWDGGSDAAVDGNIVLGTLGYSYFEDGAINGTLTGFPRQTNLKIHSTGKLSIPLFMTIADRLLITDDSSNTKDFDETADANNSNAQIKIVNVSPSKFSGYGLDTTGNYKLEFYLGLTKVHTAYLEILCEGKYDPVQLIYMNSMGMWDYMTFFKASTRTIEAKRTMYMNNTIDYGAEDSAVSYSSEDGQMTGFLGNGYMSHVLNTGFVDESEDVRIKELLLSDHVILYDQSKFKGVQVVSNSMALQKGVNDKAMNYTISIKETGSVINKVY